MISTSPHLTAPSDGSSPASRLNDDVLYMIFIYLAPLYHNSQYLALEATRHDEYLASEYSTPNLAPRNREAILYVCRQWTAVAKPVLRRYLNLGVSGGSSMGTTRLQSWLNESERLKASGRIFVEEMKMLKLDYRVPVDEEHRVLEMNKQLISTVDGVKKLHLTHADTHVLSSFPALRDTKSVHIQNLYNPIRQYANQSTTFIFPNLKQLSIKNSYLDSTKAALPLFPPSLDTLLLSPGCSILFLPLRNIRFLTCDANAIQDISPDTPLAVEELGLWVDDFNGLEKWEDLLKSKAFASLKKLRVMSRCMDTIVDFDAVAKTCQFRGVKCDLITTVLPYALSTRRSSFGMASIKTIISEAWLTVSIGLTLLTGRHI